MRRTLVALAAVAMFGGTAFGQTTFSITAERVGSGTIGPGDTVEYQIVVELSDTPNDGLALIGFDLSFDGGSLAQADTPVDAPMDNFVKNAGLTNPAGYGGTIDSSGAFDVLLQVGGAQNTIKNFVNAENAPYPISLFVNTLVAEFGSPQVVATGSLTAPAVGSYTLSISNAFANVITSGQDGNVFWATEEALVGTTTNVEIIVSDCVLRSYIASVPDASDVGESAIRPGGTLWRTRENVIRITLDGAALAAPNPGDVEIRELQGDGAFGPDLSATFDFSMEAGNTVLRIKDQGSTILHQKWYAISNASWACVASFERHYASAYGDGNGDGLVQFADLAFINSEINQPPASPDADRHDINGDNLIQFADLAAANATINLHAIAKPTGH